MHYSEFDKRYTIEYYSNEWRIWDKTKSKYVGDGFTCVGEAKFFLRKLKNFLFEYDL